MNKGLFNLIRLCLIILGFIVFGGFLSGCSGIQHQTEMDKINAIHVPEGVYIKLDSKYAIQKATGRKICGYADWLSFEGICTIVSVPVAEVVKHEIRHCLEGAWHGNNKEYEAC